MAKNDYSNLKIDDVENKAEIIEQSIKDIDEMIEKFEQSLDAVAYEKSASSIIYKINLCKDMKEDLVNQKLELE